MTFTFTFYYLFSNVKRGVINMTMYFTQYLYQKKVMLRFIITICIFIAFISTILIYNNIYVKDTLKKEHTRNIEYVDYMSGIVNSEIDNVKKNMIGFSFDPNLVSLSGKYENDKQHSNVIFNIWRIRDTIRFIRSNSDIILDLYVFLPGKKLIINANGCIESGIFFDNIIKYENIDILGSLPDNREYKTFNNANTIYIREHNKLLNSTLCIYPINNKNGYIIVSINKRSVNSLITRLTETNLSKNSISFITDSDGGVVFSNLSQQSDKNLGINFKKLISDGKGMVRLNSNDYYGVKSNNKSIYHYLLLLPDNTMSDYIKKINIYTICSMIFIILITFFIAIVCRKRIYLPVKQCIDKLMTDLKRKRSEYRVLKSNYDNVYSKLLNTKNSMDKQNKFIENICYTGFLSGVLDKKDNYIKSKVDEINSNIGKYLAVKSIVEDDNGNKPMEIVDIIEHRLSGKFILRKIYSGKKEDIYILKVDTYDELIEKLNKIYISVNVEKGVYCLAGVSTVFNDISLLQSACNEADLAINTGESKNKVVFEYSRINNEYLLKSYLKTEDEQELMNNVINGWVEGVENLLNSKIFSDMNIPLTRQKDVYLYLISNLKYLANSRYPEMKKAFSTRYEDIIDRINNTYNTCISMFLVKRCYIEMTHFISENNNSKERQILDFINNNFNEDLYIELLANKFDIAPGYMSAYFKKITGTTFLSYLQKVRINKAKEMIIQSDKKIYEIANEVGYKDVSNFITNFKMLVGTSPGDYKKQTLCCRVTYQK